MKMSNILLLVVNTMVSLASAAFAVLAITDPGALLGVDASRTAPVDYYSQMYAARSIIFSAGVVALLIAAMASANAVSTRTLGGVLAVAGLIQIADVVIAVIHDTPGGGGAAVAAAVHIGSAVVLLSPQGRRLHTLVPKR